MKSGYPGMLCPRRGRGLLIRVALVVLMMAPVLDAGPGAGTERLSRIRYRWAGREQEAVGAVTYKGTERAALRLFDETLAGYYTIYVDTGELMAVELLSHVESEAVCVERAVQQATAKRRREDVARQRREARAVTRRESARNRSERAAAQARGASGRHTSAGGATSLDPNDIRAVRRERERRIRAVERSIDRVAQALEPLGGRLDAVVRAHNRNVSSVRARLDGTPLPARLRAWVGEFESFSEELEVLSSHLDSRRGAVDRLRRNLATHSLRTREASEAAEGILARIASLQKRLARAEKSAGEHRALIA